ncbi:MAG: response regulator [Polaromonas sp.]|jgi:FixJ family two-component response regulator
MTTATVFIVDDDAGIRSSLVLLMETDQLPSACFASADAFLTACGPNPTGCLILDVRMPGLSGLQLQDELALRHISLPIIFLTGYADVPMTVGAMRKGAVDFLIKPIDGGQLLALVHSALETDRRQREAATAHSLLEARLLKLTPREREVLVLALSGLPNKTISKELNISVRTTEGHRAQIFLKLSVDSLIELAQQAGSAGMPLADIATLQPK